MIKRKNIDLYDKRILASLPIVIVLLIVGWFSFNTMWLKDTMMYQFFCNSDFNDYPVIRISSLRMIWESQINHYITTNGRFFCHVLVQIFSGLVSPWIFKVMNVLVWFLFLNVIVRLSGVRFDFRSISVVSSLVLCCFIFLPFDPAYSINYVWMGAMNLYFIFLFYRDDDTKGAGKIVLFILLGIYSFLSGQGNENYSLPICAALMYVLISSGFRVSSRQWVMGVCYAIGSITVGLAPAVFFRLNRAAPEFSLMHGFAGAAGYFILPVVVLVLSCRKKWRERMYSGSIYRFLLVCLVVNLIFTALLRFNYASRMLIFADICSVVFICRCFRQVRPSAYLVTGCYMVLACLTVSAAKQQISMNRRYGHEISEYHRSVTGRIYLPDDEYFCDQYSAWSFRNAVEIQERSENPDKPDLRIYPESLRGRSLPKDSNVAIRIGEQSWILCQSHSNPKDFIIHKRIRLLSKEVSPRKAQFSKENDIFVDSTATHTILAYRNRRGYLESSIEILENK